MQNKICIIVIFILIFPSIAINIESKENINPIKYEKGYRYNIQGWVYLHIEGEPYERGYQYGYLASAEIINMINRWAEHGANFKIFNIIPVKNSEQAWDIYKTRAVNKFLKQVPEEYKQEIHGIADGIKARGGKINGRGIEYEDIVTLQLLQDAQYSINFLKKTFHPIRGIFNGLKEILSGGLRNYESGHCSVFMATGDATIDGGIVATHSSNFNAVVAERCNFILDVKPSKGYRFIMSTLPGSIWSQEDYYQNDQGIILTESELPQGPWTMRGTPKGVRSRRAIQYSDSIDDVIKELKNENNGLIPNEWLIGDTKTGEIASIQLALYNTPVKRTFNGFYWSCNIPHDLKVIGELYGVPLIFLEIISKISPEKLTSPKDEKFRELKKQYYGSIDEEIVKKIMATSPICERSTDCKITTSKMMKNNGLIVLMGNTNGDQFNPTPKQKEKYSSITEIPSSGWAKIYPSKSKPNNIPERSNKNIIKDGRILWENDYNRNYSYNVIFGNQIFVTTKTGYIYSIEPIKNKEKDVKKVNEEVISTFPNLELKQIETNTEKIKWKCDIGPAASKPVIIDDHVIVGCLDGNVHILDVKTGDKEWTYSFSDSAYISNVKNNKVYVGSEETCYALDTNKGKLLWEYKTDGPITSPPSVSDGKVYVGSWDGRLYAIDAETGKTKWTYQTGWGIDTTPAIKDNKLYFGSTDNNFYALNKEDGKLEWYYTCNAAIHSSPQVYGECVFFGSDDGRLYAIDKETGNAEWAFAPGYTVEKNEVNNYITTPVTSDPIVKNDLVYIDVEGTSYVLDAQTHENYNDNKNEKPKKTANNLLILFIFLSIILLIAMLLIYLSKKRKIN